jgi:hypothetical protein
MATQDSTTRTYHHQPPGWEAPFPRAAEVAPADDAMLAVATRSLYVGQAGDVRVMTVEGDIVTFRNHPVGYLPGQIVRVYATGTTAGAFVAVW